MNNVLQLKGTFEQAPNNSKPGPPNLPSGKVVKVTKLKKLCNDLIELKKYWEKDTLFSGALISVYYNKVAAKSNRINGLLTKGNISANSTIVGARFSESKSPKHIITHYLTIELIEESIIRLQSCLQILNHTFGGEINCDTIKKINMKQIVFNPTEIAKTNFLKVIVDSYYVEKFGILVDEQLEFKEDSLITIYKTEKSAVELMGKLGMNLQFTRVMDNTTLLLRPDELNVLKQKAPFLISMAVHNITELTKDDFDFCEKEEIKIPSPVNEPTIGVIDTMFDENVYFSEWVEFTNMLSKDIPLSSKDYEHGTAVSSIIVDGPSFNPQMDDGCGRFRVRHFGVAAGNQFSSFAILRDINEIISKNKDIKVWNLSLGSKLEINKNFISPEAAILDKIQYENDVIFIIAGTNQSSEEKIRKFIGAPADSINSLVINSVNFEKKAASYSRKGPVLSFFTKPDVCYYGGDGRNLIRVCTPMGEAFVKGTSFAAPWIARKMSYLIDILGLSREVAKALIINASTGWNKQEEEASLVGYGTVPIKIDDIIHSSNDEIQFILSGVSEKYDTYNYNIPIPINKKKHPFVAKATLCYFPCCNRNQGVDYTNTELDISFGRLNNKIKPINNNYQTDETEHFVFEEDARKLFRKWDNIKHIREVYTQRSRAKEVYGKGLWGVSLKTKERLNKKYGEGIKFAIVVTLKEINGVNRIDEFIKNCSLRGWLVNKIEVENRIDIYNIAEEEIDFKDFE
ncbi:S8 family peptidase [Anaerosacchariphilus polymeriproducens]|uniref:Serine protease n=1 Tax=Anaerosacchariphilus polymeriproducens TaxID=1812858 RepID=A0A371AX83_9FIRM|nr:S8 family peptidase [Anaerosacchariphilus polymeriproducens]RDU24183.1 serine protease [Anaerosacchariphilus polymeriproducens]